MRILPMLLPWQPSAAERARPRRGRQISHPLNQVRRAPPRGPARGRELFVLKSRNSSASLLGAVMLTTALADAWCGIAGAQGRLDASYVVTLAGLPIGKGSWTIDVQEDQFSATASGATSGLLRVLASGQGSSAARGTMAG